MRTDQISSSKMAGSSLALISYPVFTRVSRFSFDGALPLYFVHNALRNHFCPTGIPVLLVLECR